jgi:hypothetical protein
MSVRGKRWKLRRNSSARISEGTILHAVPKESPQQQVVLSALEIEMATSPNEEILRNIGLSPAESDPPLDFVPSSPVVQTFGSQRKRSRKGSKGSQDSIIGVWKDGSVEWDANQLSVEVPPRPKSTGVISASQEPDAQKKSLRPKIQVVIPKSFSTRQPYFHRPYRSNSAIVSGSKNNSIPQQVSPPSVMSRQSSVDSFRISALTPPGVTQLQAPRRPAPPPPVVSENTHSLDAAMATLKVPEKAPHQSSATSSSNGSVSGDDDNASEHGSNRSSMTSIDSQPAEELQASPQERRRRRQKSPLQSKHSPNTHLLPALDDEAIKPFDCLGSPIQPAELEGSPVVRKREGPSLADLIGIVRTPSTQRSPANRSTSRHGGRKLRTLVESNEEDGNEYSLPSPTLSEAERSLEAELVSQMGSPVGSPRLERTFSVRRKPVMTATPPPPPPRSAKRRSIGKAPVIPAADETTKNALRIRGLSSKTMPESPKIGLARSASTRSYLSLIAEEEDREIPADSAESVLYHILHHLGSLDDLFNMAIINRGFYRVFKRHELEITRAVLKKMSPAAWEYRETCLPLDRADEDSAVPPPEYTAASYIESYMRDANTIGRIKDVVLKRCHSMLRVETVEALTSHNERKGSTVDNALWRIWTFCRVFGCNRNREEDIVVQTDWLKGGPLAHQTACGSTICSSDSFYISSTLLNVPEHFAMGNGAGLTAEELYDMTEMWNCLRSITHSIGGRTEQARQHGVFDNTAVRGGDIDGEELMLGKSTSSYCDLLTAVTNSPRRRMARPPPHPRPRSHPRLRLRSHAPLRLQQRPSQRLD